MKRIPLLLIATAFICQSFTLQSREEILREMERQTVTDSNEKRTIVTGEDKFRVDNPNSSVRAGADNRNLNTLESVENKDRADFEYKSSSDNYRNRFFNRNEDQDYDDEDRNRGARSFRGHWSGLEVGFNNYNHARSMNLPDDISYMKLDANNSVNFNLNFSQLSIGFCRYAGIVTGIGLNWNNYRFQEGNSITVDADGIISPVFFAEPAPPVKRSRFSTFYLTMPAMLEIQIPAGYGNHLNVAGGFIGGLKLNAWTKVVYEDGEKSRANGDYNLNLLRGGVTARIGYQNFMIYGTYYLTPWFQELKGPDGINLEPFEIGLAFTFND